MYNIIIINRYVNKLFVCVMKTSRKRSEQNSKEFKRVFPKSQS